MNLNSAEYKLSTGAKYEYKEVSY